MNLFGGSSNWGTCKYCGEKIVWAQMPGGHWLPMEPHIGGKHECGVTTAVAEKVEAHWQVGFHPGGVRVGEVLDDSPASNARPRLKAGDVIVKANGEAVPDMTSFEKLRNAIAPGEELRLRVVRGNRRVTIKIRRHSYQPMAQRAE